jgi:hypothetical protein
VQLQRKHEPSCQWYLHGVYHNNYDSFEILKLKEPHTCNNSMVMQAHHWIDSDFIANMMLTIVKAKISIKIVTIQATIYKDILYDILYKKSWLAKKKILERLFRSYEEFFQILPRLLLALKESNFGIIIEWNHKMVDGDTIVFGRVF